MPFNFPRLDGANFANFPDFPELTEVVLTGKFTAADFDALPPWKKLTQVRGGTSTNDENLAAIARRTKITVLAISNARLSDDGLAALKDLKNLKELYISSTGKVTGAGLVHLTQLPKLEILSLGAEVFEARHLAFLAQMKSLVKLELNAKTVAKEPDECLKQLAALQGHLTEFTLAGVKVLTAEQISAVQRSIPKLKIKVTP